MANLYAKELEHHGIVRLPELVSRDTLADMQRAFARRLQRLRWNDFDGYEKTEPYRHMVQDILTLAQGFVDVSLHPLVKETLHEYLGDAFELVEAKGWLSKPTQRDFHGWHGDAWYDQEKVTDRIPREVKLGFYLTDVKSGAFQFLKGTHGKQHPHNVPKRELSEFPLDQMMEVTGPAGSAFLFDTSGIHRQGVPMLEPRQAFFLNYHDPFVPLQKEDVDYYRYHPLILNAALLGNLSEGDRCLLGFGNKTNYQPHFERAPQHTFLQGCQRIALNCRLWTMVWSGRIGGRLRRLLGRGGR